LTETYAALPGLLNKYHEPQAKCRWNYCSSM